MLQVRGALVLRARPADVLLAGGSRIILFAAGKLLDPDTDRVEEAQHCISPEEQGVMAKKDNFDDVLGNKFSLVNAKSSKLLSSWMGPAPAATTHHVSDDAADDDADLKQADFGHDRCAEHHAIKKNHSLI